MNTPHRPTHPPAPVDLARESVAGEEDPGASLDQALTPTPPAPAPGDEAPPGTPGSGEDVCPRCGGSGRIGDGMCPVCSGSGKVNRAIGGA